MANGGPTITVPCNDDPAQNADEAVGCGSMSVPVQHSVEFNPRMTMNPGGPVSQGVNVPVYNFVNVSCPPQPDKACDNGHGWVWINLLLILAGLALLAAFVWYSGGGAWPGEGVTVRDGLSECFWNDASSICRYGR